MLLDHLGEPDAAQDVERAVAETLAAMPSAGTDSGIRTDEIGERVVGKIRQLAAN